MRLDNVERNLKSRSDESLGQVNRGLSDALVEKAMLLVFGGEGLGADKAMKLRMGMANIVYVQQDLQMEQINREQKGVKG